MNRKLLAVSLFLTLSNPFIFTDTVDDLVEAIKEGDLDRVIALVEEGADVDVYYKEYETPLHIAVYYNQFEIAQYLISKGADINAKQLDIEGYTPLDLALENDNQAMIELLLSSSAKHDFYLDEMYAALFSGDLEKAEELILEGKASLLDDILRTLYYYENGTLKARELIEEYGPEGIKDGSLNLLDYIIPGFFDVSFWWISFPMSTTFLRDVNDPFLYSPSKAFDNDLTTCWVEGVDGHGIGQKIAFYMAPDCNCISIVPGYGVEIYFLLNNRVKKAVLKFYVLTCDIFSMIHNWMMIEALDYSVELNFTDELRYQTFELQIPPLPPVEEWDGLKEILAVLEILEVYPGTKWDDTCIAEIKY